MCALKARCYYHVQLNDASRLQVTLSFGQQ